MWIHRQEVDDVGPVLAALVAVTHWRDEIASRSAWSRIRTRRSVSRAGSDAIQDGNRSDLPPGANEDHDDQEEDDESEDHQAQVRGPEFRVGPSDRRRRARIDRCPAAVAHTARIRYRCGRDVRIVGPVMNAHMSSFRFFLLFTSPQVKATERMGDRVRLRGFDLPE